MTAIRVRRRGGISFGVFTLVMVALFVGLGVWQLQRRVEKHALIAALTERLAAAPSALPQPAQWNALTPDRDEFRRVSFAASYQHVADAMVYSSGSAVREDIAGPGTWAFMPARLATGETVVINAGFIQNTMQDRSLQDRAVAQLITGEPLQLTGYIRFPESAGPLTPAENPTKRLWFTRDHLAMARALGWGEVAPFYIDLEAPVPPSGVPKPGPLEVHLKDDHMQYAITWFALAGAVVIAFGVWLRGQRRGLSFRDQDVRAARARAASALTRRKIS
jgi:cytochrome oxidase assembly protein ShyY1